MIKKYLDYFYNNDCNVEQQNIFLTYLNNYYFNFRCIKFITKFLNKYINNKKLYDHERKNLRNMILYKLNIDSILEKNIKFTGDENDFSNKMTIIIIIKISIFKNQENNLYNKIDDKQQNDNNQQNVKIDFYSMLNIDALNKMNIVINKFDPIILIDMFNVDEIKNIKLTCAKIKLERLNKYNKHMKYHEYFSKINF
jgi:hypothetical protein